MEEHGVDLVVAEAAVRYRGSLRFDDVFLMRATIANLGTTSMTTAIRVERDGEEIVEGEMRHVFVGRDGSGKTEIPARVRQALEAYVRETA
jgi:acyl-CoA thioesterase FadM